MRTLLVVCLAGTLFAQSSKSSLSPRSGGQEKGAYNEQSVRQNNPPKSTETTIRATQPAQSPAAANAGQGNNQPEIPWRKYFREAFSAAYLSNWVLAFFAVVAAGIALKTLNSIKVQSGISINSERAWLIVTSVAPVKLDPKAWQTEFRFRLANRGRSVARFAGPNNWRFQVVPGDSGLPETPDYGKRIAMRGERPEGPVHARVLAPGDDTGIDLAYPEDMDGELFAEIQDRRRWFYFYASFKYFDFADTERELQICYLYVPKTEASPERWELGGPPEYNKHT